MPHKLKYRLVVLGRCGVGKTTVLETLVYPGRSPRPLAPTSEDIYECTIETGSSDRSQTGGERVHIYDTAGQLSDKMKHHYLTLADGFLLIYSCSALKESFAYIKDMRQDIESARGRDIPIVVMGTKLKTTATSANRSVATWAHAQSLFHYETTLGHRPSLIEPFVAITNRMAHPGKRSYLSKK
ncbi:NF-kappa-B inhibitor-interacting Ras-like protein 1 [Oscarella lobularis]|uniref:NF-kappa-B inhibitor-interacting Ras-like protein 1 n=1 Tax=Oscarella lobularis TaxID=121494 RepID=UPI003313397A